MANFWDFVTTTGEKFASPLAQKLIFGKPIDEASVNEEWDEERKRVRRKSGDGVVDEQAAKKSPQSIFEFLLGKQTVGGATSYSPWPLAFLVGAVGIIIYLWRR